MGRNRVPLLCPLSFLFLPRAGPCPPVSLPPVPAGGVSTSLLLLACLDVRCHPTGSSRGPHGLAPFSKPPVSSLNQDTQRLALSNPRRRSTHRPPEHHGTRIQVHLHHVALGHHLHPLHLALGQHLVHEVIPGNVASAGAQRIEQTHDHCDDEQGAQPLSVHLVLALPAPALLCR